MFSFQMSLHKQALDKEIDTMKEKLKWTEGQLQDSQKKEAQTQAKLTVTHTHTIVMAVSLGSACVNYSVDEQWISNGPSSYIMNF